MSKLKLIRNVYIPKESGSGLEKVNIIFDDKILEIRDTKKVLTSEEVKDDTSFDIIDGKGLVALPGLIDVHVHLREPGFKHKETIKTGTAAAAAGGFTTIMAMPNVNPFPDNMATMDIYQAKLDADALVNVVPYACITKGEEGKELVDMEEFKYYGYKSFSDDGRGIQDNSVMEEAMKKSAELNVKIVAHTEDEKYIKPGACMHEFKRAKALGYVGIPSAAEYKQLERDLKLVAKTGAHYHACHISAKESVMLLRKYKLKGLDVTCEVTAHHLVLTDQFVVNSNFKMNPPVRAELDRQMLIEGLKDGTIDMIASDHAPHTKEEKSKGMVDGPFGIISLETTFPLMFTYLVRTGYFVLADLIRFMCENPAKRFGFKTKGKLAKGYDSDIVLVDLKKNFTIDRNTFLSKGRNTPFDGWDVYGKVKKTFVGGQLVYDEELGIIEEDK